MRHTTTILLAAALGLAADAEALDIYVSPAGDDANPGTAAAPFATLATARDAIRAGGKAGREAITVHLADGFYFLDETLTLTPEDSGSRQFPVVYRAEHEGRAALSGAVRLAGLKFSPQTEGILKAKLPAELLASCAFDQLFLGDELLDQARYPNRDESAPVFNGITTLAEVNRRAAGYRKPETGAIHALHGNRWGSVHYRVTGFAGGRLKLSGGWQQNRQQRLKTDSLMIENIFEELDAPGEWFLDRDSATLYIWPPDGAELLGAVLDEAGLYAVNLQELVHFKGSEERPVAHIELRGIQFRHARRVALAGEDQWEGLLRGDWSIVRSGAVLLEGTEHCAVRDCRFGRTGGNGVFFSNFNRHSEVTDSRFEGLGESAVCFVGNYAATRSNPIGYENSFRYDAMDLTPGPKGNDYPRYCKMDGCLVFAIGRVGKQTAGALVSMAENITISHNTIYHVPRSGITINDGCWGGHLVEHNDVFDTVIETGDHGPFNSWGRDRYWVTKHHGSKRYREDVVSGAGEVIRQEESRRRSRLDNRTPTVIRNNRWWHGASHTWGIDLDDGSSNYHVYNNLALGCSVKLREGFYRRIENNIFIGNQSVQMHVPFDHNRDTIARNIIVLDRPNAYVNRTMSPVKMHDGELIDKNLFWSLAQHFDPSLENAGLEKFQAAGIDVNSISADPLFRDPLNLDFRLDPDSPAIRLGFKPFELDNFGVTKPALVKLARRAHRDYNTFKPEDYWGEPARAAFAKRRSAEKTPRRRTYVFLGATVKNLETEAEKSTAGVGETRGVFVLEVPPGSKAAALGLAEGDAVVEVNGRAIRDVEDLLKYSKAGKKQRIRVIGATDRQIEYRMP